MFLRLNRILFGALVFALQMSILGPLVYFAVMSIAGLILGMFDLGVFLITSLYVMGYCAIFTSISFLISGVVKEIRKYHMPVWEGYFFVFIGAVPMLIYLSFPFLFTFFLIVLVSAVIISYFGEKIYRKVWNKVLTLG